MDDALPEDRASDARSSQVLSLSDTKHKFGWTEGSLTGTKYKHPFLSIIKGLLLAIVGVGIRYIMPVGPNILPFAGVYVMMMASMLFCGRLAGLTTMFVGALLTWYFVLTPRHTFDTSRDTIIVLIGYFIVAGCFQIMAEMLHKTEEKRQQQQLAEAQRFAEEQWLYARELSHRVKNSLAMVQSLASQTFNSEPACTSLVPKFVGRVKALADAQSLLTAHSKHPIAHIRELVEAAMAPFEGYRFSTGGPDIQINDQQAISLALAIHELATNAVKYGAFSVPQGQVEIEWRVEGAYFVFSWKEHGGPRVVEPTERGFGTNLLSRSAMGATFDFAPAGLRCEIRQRCG